jgi:hypothetical protein
MNFSRYEARLERSFHKNLTALQRLRAQRKSEMTNQSQSKEIPTPIAKSAAVDSHVRPAAEPARPVSPPPAPAVPHPASVFP